jgi:Helix-turn-helix domain
MIKAVGPMSVHFTVASFTILRVTAIADDYQTLPPEQTFLTPEQVARVLGVSRSWVYQHQADLPVTRLGDGPRAPIRVDVEDLRVWLVASQRGQVETR